MSSKQQLYKNAKTYIANELLKSLSGITTGTGTIDFSAYWLTRAIQDDFREANSVSNSSFKVIQAEKKDKIFYIQNQTIFPLSGNNHLYRNTYYIFFSTPDSTIFVFISDPWSDTQRPHNPNWPIEWFTGLKMLNEWP